MLILILTDIGIPPEVADYLLSSGQGTDFRSAARTILRELRGELEAAFERITYTTTKAHLEDLRQEVEQILSGDVSPSAGSPKSLP